MRFSDFLPLVSNMYALLTDNIACKLGLSNGNQGIFRRFVYDEQEDVVPFNTSNAVFPSIKNISQRQFSRQISN